MIPLTYLPSFVLTVFRGMPGVWKSRHQLLFSWLIMMQAVAPGPKTVKGLSLWCPSRIRERHFRRLLSAGYWSVFLLLHWFAEEAVKSFPPPEDGVVYAVADSSEKPKRGKKNPSAQKGRKSKNKPWFFGIRFVILAVCRDVFRIPADFRIILPKDHKDYRNENQLFREMPENFQPPDRAKTVIVMGDAAYGSKDNMKAVRNRDKAFPAVPGAKDIHIFSVYIRHYRK